MFPCAQTMNLGCTGRTEIIHCGRSFPALPFRLQCPVQVVTALQDKEAFPSQTQRVSLQVWGCQSPGRAGKCPHSAAREEPLCTTRAAAPGPGWVCHTYHFKFALLMTQLPPSLVWLVWVSLEFSLCPDEGFLSEGCTSECSW